DPYLFGNYWNGILRYSNNSDGYEQEIRATRPFYSFVTRWAADAGFDNLKQDERIWDLAKEISVFHQKHEEVLASYGRALIATDAEALRLTGGFHLVKDDFEPGAGPAPIVPDPRNFRYVFARLDIAQNDFLKSNYVNRDVRY